MIQVKKNFVHRIVNMSIELCTIPATAVSSFVFRSPAACFVKAIAKLNHTEQTSKGNKQKCQLLTRMIHSLYVGHRRSTWWTSIYNCSTSHPLVSTKQKRTHAHTSKRTPEMSHISAHGSRLCTTLARPSPT